VFLGVENTQTRYCGLGAIRLIEHCGDREKRTGSALEDCCICRAVR